MRNKKGFTLTEILVTIAIIGIVLLIAVPSIMSINRSIKKRELETKKEAMISAAEKYVKSNISEFGGATIIQIPVRTLVYYGYVNSDEECSEPIGCVIDPTNDESMNDEIITIKRNMSITQATWGEESGTYYLATFKSNGNGCTIGRTQGNETEIKLGCQANVYCEIRTPRIKREGFEILGWATSASSHEAEYSTGEKIEINSDQTYYTVTKKNVVVTFNGNGGQIEGENTKGCSYYNTSTSCAVEDVVARRTGYGKEGWYTSALGTEKVSLDSIDKSQTVYAHWMEGSYTLSYNLKEGTATNPSSYKVSTETFTLNNPTKIGYTFTGWTGTDLTSQTKTVTIPKGSVGDRDYEAFYNANTFTVAYNRNGGSGSTTSHTCTYDASCTLKNNSFTRGGHIFQGWKKENSGSLLSSGASIKNAVTSGTVTYYAQWNACPAGKYAAAGATSCSACTGNTYTSASGQSSCSTCSAGSIPNSTHTGCNKCSAGQYAAAGATTCSACTGNTYTSTSGQSSCTACPAGQAANSTHTGCSTNVLTLLYNGNGHTGFSSTSTSHNFTVDSSNYVLDNGVRYSQTANYGSVFDSSSGLANYNNAGFINFTKTGYHGVSDAEWKIGSTTFGHNDKTITAEALATAGGCDLSIKSCTVTAYVNWTSNRLFIQYNGNGGTWGSTNTNYNVNEYGTVITTSNNEVYTQKVNYGKSLSDSGFVDMNGSYFKWTKAGYVASSGKQYYIKTDSAQTKLSQSTSYTASYLAGLGGCTNFDNGDCVIQLKVNWSACPAGKYAAAGATTCSSCAGNTYTSSSGQSSCTTCPTGYTANSTHTGCTANTFTVAYNANGGSGSVSSHTCTYDSSCTLRNNSFTRKGYTFAGWKKWNSGTTLSEGASIKNASTSGTVTYYAQWSTKQMAGCPCVGTPNTETTCAGKKAYYDSHGMLCLEHNNTIYGVCCQ